MKYVKIKEWKNDISCFVYEISSLIVVIMALYVYFWNVKGGTYGTTANLKERCGNTA